MSSAEMGLQVEGGGKKSPQKMVTIVQTPDYIPTINTSAIMQNSSVVGKKDDSAKQWGRVKKVADIWSECKSNNDTDSVRSDDDVKPKTLGVEDLRRVTRLFIRSTRAVQKIRAKYSANALKRLQKRQTNSLLDLTEIGGANIDPNMFTDYSLADMYLKLKQQKHIKLAVLQQKFINELPVLKEISVKENLERKIRALERIKHSSYVQDAIPTNETKEQEPSEPFQKSFETPALSRRQSRLRQSVDMDAGAAFGRSRLCGASESSHSAELPGVQLTVADVERELALFKSRERIENDLHLPGDRMARFALLKSNVNKINVKFHKLTRGTKLEKDKKGKDQSEEDKPFYVPSRFTVTGMVSWTLLPCLSDRPSDYRQHVKNK